MTLSLQSTAPADEPLIENFTAQAVHENPAQGLPLSDQESLDVAQMHRAACYGLIAAVTQRAPDQAVLAYISQLSAEPPAEADELLLSMSALGLAAGLHSPATLDDEFHDLFIGLGRGEVVPYGSWYLTGFLQEKPLSDLRTDLGALGFARDDETNEPEDHVAALCEVMQIMISEGIDIDIQRRFFNTHMAPWMDRFFADLGMAESAVFYKTLARFAAAYLDFEREYFSMQT